MQVFHHYHQSRLHKMIHSKFWMFEFSIWLHTFSRAMVAVFIPIFLLELGYSIELIIVYYFMVNTVNTPLNFTARWLIRRIGARNVLIIGSIFSVVFFISLSLLTANNLVFLIFIAVLAGIYDACYWVAHLYLFMKCSDKDENVSEDAGTMLIVQRVAGMIAPVVGVGVLLLFSKKILIILSVVVLIVSIIVLFRIKNLPDKPTRRQRSAVEFFSSWDILKDYIITGLFSVHRSVENIIWPLFIYIFFMGDIKSVAIIPVIVSITTIIFAYLTGKVSKSKRVTMIAVGSSAIAIMWVLRVLIDDGAFYYFSIFLVGLFSVIVSIPTDSRIYEKGEKIDTLSTSMWFNLVHMLANAMLFGFLIITINVFHLSFAIAAGSMVVLVIVTHLIGRVIEVRK